MALSYLVTCDRCGCCSTSAAGWHRLTDMTIRTADQVTVEPRTHHDLCPVCLEVVMLALAPDPLADLPVTGETP